MGTIYDGAFRTVLNDCRKLIIPVINEIFGETYTGEGDMMRGAMIETSAKRILNQGKSQGINETKKKTALRMLQDGELSIDKIAECAELSVAEVEQLAGGQNV